MDASLRDQLADILRRGQDLTLATLRPDGWPQANTLSYASDGTSVFVGTGPQSQKVRNIAHDPRVSITINLPYADWTQIRGLSAAGRARLVTDGATLARAGQLFVEKFRADLAREMELAAMPMAMFEITLEVVSLLDYAKGFGHTDLLMLRDTVGEAA